MSSVSKLGGERAERRRGDVEHEAADQHRPAADAIRHRADQELPDAEAREIDRQDRLRTVGVLRTFERRADVLVTPPGAWTSDSPRVQAPFTRATIATNPPKIIGAWALGMSGRRGRDDGRRVAGRLWSLCRSEAWSLE